jgi:hypothetical protein
MLYIQVIGSELLAKRGAKPVSKLWLHNLVKRVVMN